jgi:hypothetical protein
MKIPVKSNYLLGAGLFLFSWSKVFAFADYIEISQSTPFLAQPSFNREAYQLAELHPGSKAQIVSLNTNHTKGVSFQVRINEGPNRGQLGWVYLSEAESQRTLKLLNREQKEVSLNSTKGDITSFKSQFSTLAKSMSPTESSGITSKIPELVSAKSDQELWRQFMAGELSAKPSVNEELVTLEKTVVNADGETQTQKYHLPADPTVATLLASKAESAVVSAGNVECEEEAPVKVHAARGATKWLKGCEVLGSSIGEQSRTKLEQCFTSIKATISEGRKLKPSDRAKVFPTFYSKLNSVEQEFLASMVTSIGEAGVLAPPPEEMVAIMMVLKNRKEDAQEKGFSGANMLDTALQSLQFSMYNRGAHHWSDALNRPNSDSQTQHAFDAFIKFKNLKISASSPLKDVFHYHTDKVSPDWKSPSKILKMVLDGVRLKQTGSRHIFYEDIGWSFKHNPWSNK